MGITVGAALKKAAIAVLTEPKALKNLAMAILVVLVAMLLPMVMVVCLFSGSFRVDSGELLRYVEANLTAADVQLLRNVEDTMTEIETAMVEAEFSSEVGAAQSKHFCRIAFPLVIRSSKFSPQRILPRQQRKKNYGISS